MSERRRLHLETSASASDTPIITYDSNVRVGGWRDTHSTVLYIHTASRLISSRRRRLFPVVTRPVQWRSTREALHSRIFSHSRDLRASRALREAAAAAAGPTNSLVRVLCVRSLAHCGPPDETAAFSFPFILTLHSPVQSIPFYSILRVDVVVFVVIFCCCVNCPLTSTSGQRNSVIATFLSFTCAVQYISIFAYCTIYALCQRSARADLKAKSRGHFSRRRVVHDTVVVQHSADLFVPIYHICTRPPD